jgi:hypothetical protein
MQLWQGNYGFPVNGALVTSRTEVVRSDSGRPLRWRMYLDVEFTLKGSGPAQLSALENAARDALSRPYVDLVLRDDTGIPTSSRLVNADSISGVMVVDGPTFRDGQGPEFVTLRTGRFTAVAEYVFRGAETALVSFTESISVQGNGGPVRNWRLPVNARPIRQEVTPYSIIRYTQQGAAVGHLIPPARQPPYIDPDLLVNEQDAVSRDVGQPLGKAWINPVTRWTYVFESPELIPFNPVLPVM